MVFAAARALPSSVPGARTGRQPSRKSTASVCVWAVVDSSASQEAREAARDGHTNPHINQHLRCDIVQAAKVGSGVDAGLLPEGIRDSERQVSKPTTPPVSAELAAIKSPRLLLLVLLLVGVPSLQAVPAVRQRTARTAPICVRTGVPSDNGVVASTE